MGKCISPVYIKDQNGVVQGVPCGKCPQCINNNWQQWIFRNLQELRYSKLGLTVTLTYDELHQPILNGLGPTVLKRDVQLFIKRLRSKLPVSSLKYMLVSEYGKNTLRPHYHALLYFSHDVPYDRDTLEDYIQKAWSMGFIRFDSISSESIAYTTKYLLKDSPRPIFGEPTFMLSSRRPAIGSQYVEDNFNWHGFNVKKSYVTTARGAKIGLPRYIKDKIISKRKELFNSITDIDSVMSFFKSRIEEDRKFISDNDKLENERFEVLTKQLPTVNPFEFMQNEKVSQVERFERQKKRHKNKEKF